MSSTHSAADSATAQWTAHALYRWRSRRNEVSDRDPQRGWREAVPVDYPSARQGSWARCHVEGDCILIWTRDGGERVITTVIDLRDRPLEERAYVRAQARFGGGPS